MVINLLSYSNFKGLKNNKKCCDPGPTCQVNSCDPRILGCVSSNTTNNCDIGQFVTQTYIDQNIISFGPSLGVNIKNPVLYHFKNEWKNENITVYFKVVDVDTDHSHDFIDNFYDTLQVNISANRQKAVPALRSLAGNVSSINYTLSVYCSDNYYGRKCAIYCNTSNTNHYTCGKDGRKICSRNWHGENCLKYCKAHDDSVGHYTCNENGEKICLQSWYSEDCNTYCIVTNLNTASYKCGVNGEKICSNHWFGSDCNIFCNSKVPNSGHYTCDQSNGTKICLSSWYGTNCNVFCEEKENSTYVCSYTGERRCFPHHYGIDCNKFCQADKLSNYTCNEAGDKVCHKHYYGKDCSIYGK